MADKTYLCIDLRSFYASVECAERGLDPFRDNLVVADPSRTEKTICLAVTPAMRALGVRNRCRLFEIPPGIDYVCAPPRMRLYMEKSAEIYGTYLGYVAPEDVHAYSVDECLIDATPYLGLYGTDARSFARELMRAVFERTGVPATAGVGPNMFLAKVALDVLAKRSDDGVAELDELSYRREIWFHEPITDIWRVGPGTARRLAERGIANMAGVAAADPDALRREFGRNAELLIDHAWGLEPCEMADVKAYAPAERSIASGQVLPCGYAFPEARAVVREMAEEAALELFAQGLAATGVSLSVGYAREGGEGRTPHAGGSRRLAAPTGSRRRIVAALEALFDETADRGASVRRLGVGLTGLVPEASVQRPLFDDAADGDARERGVQGAVAAVRARFGGDAVMRMASLSEKATARERAGLIGGHRA